MQRRITIKRARTSTSPVFHFVRCLVAFHIGSMPQSKCRFIFLPNGKQICIPVACTHILYRTVGNSCGTAACLFTHRYFVSGATFVSQPTPSALGTAIVTGASSGIGKVYADRLASRGYDLLLVARRKDRLDAIAADLQARFPVNVTVLVADLANATDLTATVQKIQANSTISLLVNNAGTSSVVPVVQAAPQDIASLIALNITALTELTRAVLPGFIERNAGTIINIGSVVGFTGYAWVPIYGGTKAYVLNFTQGLKLQLAETAIRLQYVAPAGTISEIWDVMGVPMNSLGEDVLMDTEACVDAALTGLDNGEFITAPSVHDEGLVRAFEEASTALLAATQQSQPAPRYLAGS